MTTEQFAPESPSQLGPLRVTVAVSWPVVTSVVIAVNVLVYIVMVVRGVHPLNPRTDSLIPWGADYWALTTGGEPWRLVTSAFLHFGLLHLACNMWALRIVGGVIERLLGS